jgi:type II secretion system protein H
VSSSPRRRAAFTLIEMMAVVAIFALLAAFVAPNLGVLSTRRLQLQAETLSGQLEYARQRAVVTGIPHRLSIDLEGGRYRLEWYVTEREALGEREEPAALDLRGTSAIPMAAPLAALREFRPLPGMFGRDTQVEESLSFRLVDTPEGSVETGEAFVVFERDGTASHTEIVLADEDGHLLGVEVLPLADAVRIHDVEL